MFFAKVIYFFVSEKRMSAFFVNDRKKHYLCKPKKLRNMPQPRNNTRTRRQQNQIVDNTLGHMPPQSVEIEKLVLGALMIDVDAFTVVSEILRPETFYDPRHQKIYSAIVKLNTNELPVDMMTVIEQLKQDGTHDEVRAPNYIIDLTANVVSSANIEYHARLLAQKFLARQLITYASGIEGKAFDESIDVEDLMQEAEGQLFELSQKNMRQDYQAVSEVVKKAEELLKKAMANDGGMTGVPTGYYEMDKITSGWQASDLVIIAGRPAMGKTSFALSLARNIAVDYNTPIAFFSLEMNNVQLVNRLISNVCEIRGSNILSGKLSDDELERFDKRISSLSNAPIYVDDTPGLSVFELRTKARRLVREKGVKVIMIDYLQLMSASGMNFNSRQEEVSMISRSLKGLAKELDIPVLALSQLSRAVEQRPGTDGKVPQLSDLRESGAIEQDADMVLFVHRPEYYRIFSDEEGRDLRGVAQIIIAKHRKGATGTVNLNFRGEFTRFANPEDASASVPPIPIDGGEMRESSAFNPFGEDEVSGRMPF